MLCVRSAAPWSADQFSMTACSGGGAVMRRCSSSASHLNPNIVHRVHRCIDAYYIECVLQCHKAAESATTQQETNIMKTINGFFLQNFSLELTGVFLPKKWLNRSTPDCNETVPGSEPALPQIMANSVNS